MGNIKNYQQHLLFYHSLNKMFLKIAPKPIGHWLNLHKKKKKKIVRNHALISK